MLASVMLLGLVGCAVNQGKVYVKDGKEYGVTSSQVWRGRWWNYYERGSSYAEGEFWPEAIADLREAIKQRDADQRRARTYGFHFLDYFPHRELGVVYYRLGRYADAIHELEISLQSAETAKAKFYLNKARRNQLEQTQGDTAPPRILAESPQDGLLTRQFAITVKGRAEDDTYVSAIAINGKAQFIELAEPRLSFAQEITLRDGTNTIDIVAVDLLGHMAHQQLSVTLDRQGPLVSVSRVEIQRGASTPQARVEGTLSDANEVIRFVLAGRHVPLQAGREVEFREEMPLIPGTAGLPFEAEDTAGNVTRGVITGTSGAPGSRQGTLSSLTRRASLLWLPLPPGELWGTGSSPWPTSLLPVSMRAAPLRLAQSGSHAPVIKFTNLVAQQTTYYDAVYLEGQVAHTSPLTNLTLNGENLLRREAQQVFFGYNAVLQPGENCFVVEAADKGGNTARQEAVVHRKVVEVKRLDRRLRVSLMPLEKKGSATVVADTVYDQLFTALVNQERFQLVERGQLEAILREQKLSQTALVDTATAVKIGKIAAADGILLGSVTEAQNALEVFTRFVDVETTEILAAEDVYGEDVTLPTLRFLLEGLSLKLRQRFPIIQGLVLKVENQRLFFNLGHKQIKKYMKLVIYREGEPIKDPITGQVLGAPTEVLGEAKVEDVFDNLSQGIMQQLKAPGEVKQLDKAITK
jgi:hypothetical protein